MSSPEPVLVLTTLDDGCIRLTYGPLIGTVSSHHLVPSKAAQLHRAWRAIQESTPGCESTACLR